MDTFKQFKLDTQKQLNRELTMKEVMFLQWIFARHVESEQHKNRSINFLKLYVRQIPPTSIL